MKMEKSISWRHKKGNGPRTYTSFIYFVSYDVTVTWKKKGQSAEQTFFIEHLSCSCSGGSGSAECTGSLYFSEFLYDDFRFYSNILKCAKIATKVDLSAPLTLSWRRPLSYRKSEQINGLISIWSRPPSWKSWKHFQNFTSLSHYFIIFI